MNKTKYMKTGKLSTQNKLDFNMLNNEIWNFDQFNFKEQKQERRFFTQAVPIVFAC